MRNVFTQPGIDQFDAQFTPDGDGYIFRRHQKGAAIRVSADEYLASGDAFRRAQRRLIWGLSAGCFLIIMVQAFLAVAFDLDLGSTMEVVSIIAPLLALVFVFVWLFQRSYDRTANAFGHRVPIEEALSRDDFMHRYYGAMTWQKLFGQLALPFALAAIAILAGDNLHGWNQFWFALIALYAVLAGRLIWRKWRYTVPAR